MSLIIRSPQEGRLVLKEDPHIHAWPPGNKGGVYVRRNVDRSQVVQSVRRIGEGGLLPDMNGTAALLRSGAPAVHLDVEAEDQPICTWAATTPVRINVAEAPELVARAHDPYPGSLLAARRIKMEMMARSRKVSAIDSSFTLASAPGRKSCLAR